MKTVGVTDYTNETPFKHSDRKQCLSSTPSKDYKIFFKCAQLQCMKNIIQKGGGKDQESIQSCTTPEPGYHMGTWLKHKLTPQTNAKRSAFSQQVTTRQQWTDAKAWQTLDINNTNDPQKKYHLETVSKNIEYKNTGGLKPVSRRQPHPEFRCRSRHVE